MSVAFSPDGKFIVSGSADKSIKLWSIKEKKLIHSFEGHSGSVLSVAFSPDGKFIVSGSWDQSVKLWSIKEKKLVYSFDGHRGSVKTVAFLPNGKFIVSGSSNKNLKFWNIQSKNLQEDIYSKEDNWIWFDDQEKKLYLGDYKDKKNYYIHFSIKEALYNQAENTLSLIIRNDGNLTLNDVDITLLGDTQSINEIQPNQEIKKIFVTKDKIKKDDLIDVVISRKPYRWDLKVKVKTDIKRATFYVVATLLLIGMIASLYITSYYDWYSYVRKISKNPQEVFNLSLSLFLKIQRRMKQIKRLDKFLTDTMITSRKLDEAIKYEKSTNIEKLKLLAKRVEAETVRRDAPYELHFGNSFPLSIDTLVVFFTNATEPQDIQDDLKEAKILKGKIILIIPPEEAMQPLFDKLTRDRKNLYVGLLPSDVTKLLLAPNPKEILARIISSQIALTQISPYQIGGGVNREVIFFGREKIISHIINKGVTNYIVMGGRQVGKSSLLKAIERRYADIDEVECYYISASNESLVEDIKLELEQEEMSDKEFAKFINSSNNRYLFLIDEADDFVRYEKNHEYKSLKFMRSLSEKNNASFILAGFWEIYRYTYFDYESP
ncbi:MAG: AAA family ATPase, partial [Campylobacterota bacterium]|nr:AAA family ATPase [Campylobacterota bacterium]